MNTTSRGLRFVTVDAPPLPVYLPRKCVEHSHGHLPDIMAHLCNVSNRYTAGVRDHLELLDPSLGSPDLVDRELGEAHIGS